MNWSLAWNLWFIVMAVWFGYMEYKAVRDPRTGDTLTENIRAWFRLREKGPAGRLGRVIFLALAVALPVWFTVHILVPGFV